MSTIQTLQHRRTHDGFSLLEIVVAVSIMLILAVVGFVAYQSYTDNARQAAVDSAASQVFTAVVASDTVGDQDLHTIAEDFNLSSEEVRTELLQDVQYFTVIANGWEEYYAVESTDPEINNIEDLDDLESDMNKYSEGVLTFTSEGSGQLFVEDLSENATLTYEDGNPLSINRGGLINLVHPGEYTLNGGFRNIGSISAKPNLIEVSVWEGTGTEDASNMFYSSRNLESTVEPPHTVTNMSRLFAFASYYDQDIGDWNMSNVDTVHSMFVGAIRFNHDISNWDVSNITNMSNMFHSAHYFNQDLSKWDVSNVTHMYRMFRDTRRYNNGGEPMEWESVESLQSTQEMFAATYAFNQDISDWDMSGVTDMRNMFDMARVFDHDISAWDVSNVTSMEGMFRDARAFDNGGAPLNWDNIENVRSMNSMFFGALAFSQDISQWDVANVQHMSSMLARTPAFDHDISGWEVSNIRSADNFTDDDSMIHNTDKLPVFPDSAVPIV